mgnify:CR=1 FL=1
MKNLPLILAAGAAFVFFNKKSSKKTSEVDKGKPKDKTYPSIFPTRKVMIDGYLNQLPLKFDLQLDIVPLYDMVDYMKWSENGTKGLYQDWLTQMLYIQVAVNEHLWDNESSELPLFLECGKKLAITKIDPPGFDFVTFDETPEQCFNRLLLGRTVWKDINDYVKDNLTSCPPGAKCE